jgi:hypothetical protein
MKLPTVVRFLFAVRDRIQPAGSWPLCHHHQFNRLFTWIWDAMFAKVSLENWTDKNIGSEFCQALTFAHKNFLDSIWRCFY